MTAALGVKMACPASNPPTLYAVAVGIAALLLGGSLYAVSRRASNPGAGVGQRTLFVVPSVSRRLVVIPLSRVAEVTVRTEPITRSWTLVVRMLNGGVAEYPGLSELGTLVDVVSRRIAELRNVRGEALRT